MALTKSVFALLILATLSGSLGQSSKTVNWVVPANGNQYSETVPVGGSIRFQWTSNHDLWEIPSASCPSSFTNGSGITQLAARSSGGDRTVNFTTAGTRYFSCSVSSHCREGQLITVRVGSGAPAPAPGPSRYGMAYGGGATCGGNSTSGSGYGGSSGSGSNYTGNSTYGGTTPSTTTSAPVTASSVGGGSASYGGGGANYGGGSSDNYGSGRKLRSVRLF